MLYTVTYLMAPRTSESGLKVLEEEKGTRRRKNAVRRRESPLLLPCVMFSWHKTIINTDFEGHYFLRASYLQEPWQGGTV